MTEPATLAPQDIRYRTMTDADVPAGLRLSTATRWNQTEADWRLFLTLNPGGARVAQASDGTVVGTVATVRYENRFSWVAMVLVDASYRRRGIGTELLHEAIAMLHDGGTVRLDATPAGQPLYEKLAFQEEYRLSRMEAGFLRVAPTAPGRVRQMTPKDLEEVYALDREVFGAERGALLESLRQRAPQYAWVALTRARPGGGGAPPLKIDGYIFGRSGSRFEHIGPVAAPDVDTAKALVSTALCAGPPAEAAPAAKTGRPFILDVPHHSREWLAWIHDVGFAEQRPFIRMFRGEHPYPGRPGQLFAIVGPEFG